MIRVVSRSLWVVFAMVTGGTLLIAEEPRAEGLMEAIRGGTPNLDLRYRYESVNQGDIADSAHASTLRTRLGYTTGAHHGVRALVEFENVATVEGDEYNSTANGRTTRPVVADPTGSEVNRAQLTASMHGLETTLGRQRIVFDDGRFIGNVGFRQNEQTYDAARLDYATAGMVHGTYVYLWRVNDVTFRNARHDSHLAHLTVQLHEEGEATAYGYFINDDDGPASGSQTVGLRYAVSHTVGRVLVDARAEYADQSEYANSGTGKTDYWLAEVSGSIDGSGVKVGYEVLGANGPDAFQTP